MAKVRSVQSTAGHLGTSRRTFLKGAATAAGVAAFSAACAPATPQVIEKQVEVTKEVEKQVPVTVEVQTTKEVPVTVEVTVAPPKEVTNIRYSSAGWGGWLSEPWQKVIDNFNKSQSAIQVPKGYEDVAEGYQKVMAEAAGGVAADVYLFETKYMQSFAALGFFVPLDENVAASTVV
jgi:ABC-type glycerol-3-phosphate transport system substrate-binding protein